MGKKCIVCRASSKNAVHLSFHSFPSAKEERLKWMEACKIDKNVNVSLYSVCSKHFKVDDYDSFYWPNQRLLKGVVPTPSNVYGHIRRRKSRVHSSSGQFEFVDVSVVCDDDRLQSNTYFEKQQSNVVKSEKTDECNTQSSNLLAINPADIKDEKADEEEVSCDVIYGDNDIKIEETEIKVEDSDSFSEYIKNISHVECNSSVSDAPQHMRI